MKKLLLLGGSAQQVIAIETAKRLGYSTVLCDYLPDNPGQYHADKFYLVSITDKEAVLRIAEAEKIDGIIAYASDPAAPTAAYVSEKLGLRTNPYESVKTLCNKDRFRRFLAENGFHAPKACGYSAMEDTLAAVDTFQLPVIVKPVDSSGSKGATVLHNWDGLKGAVAGAFSFSRSHRVIIEEFIEKKHPYLIGGDIFVVDGKVVLWGLLNCHRDNRANPLVPVGKSYPLALEEKDRRAVCEVLQEIVDKLQIRCGAMNVELVIDKDERVWPIDIGPRNGGNMIPDLLSMIFGVDMVEMSVQAAMGEPVTVKARSDNLFCATHNLHSDRDGIYQGVVFRPDMERHIIRKILYKKPGDTVEYFQNASKALGILFMQFKNMEQMLYMMDHSEEWIQIVLDEPHMCTGGGYCLLNKIEEMFPTPPLEWRRAA